MLSRSAAGQTVPNYSIVEVGLKGDGYEYTTGGATLRANTVQRMNGSGQVLGYAQRRNASNKSLGADAWLYAGSSNHLIGLVGSGYEYVYAGTGGGLYRANGAITLNDAGQVLGLSTRFDASGVQRGSDVWLYAGGATKLIGLLGEGYESTSNGETSRYNVALQLNSAGEATGRASRTSSSGSNLGQDGWIYSGGTTRLIGFTGDNYEYVSAGVGSGLYHNTLVQSLNATGQAIGTSDRFTAAKAGLGRDAWLYGGGTTRYIGLTGAAYEFASNGTFRYSEVGGLNEAGEATGYNLRFTNDGSQVGKDGWLYSGGSSRIVALTGANYEYAFAGSIYRENSIGTPNAVGQVNGGSNRFNASGTSLGVDAWLYSGGSTKLVGLVGAGYEYASIGFGGGTYRVNAGSQPNIAGQESGAAQRYNPSGSYIGQDAWLYSGGATKAIGLNGVGYEYTYAGTGGGVYRSSDVGQVNAAGEALGSNTRFNSAGVNVGKDAWLYNAGLTHLISLAGSGYEYNYSGAGGGVYRTSSSLQMNAAGQVIGTSQRYNAAGVSLGQAGWFYDDDRDVTFQLLFGMNNETGFGNTTPAFLAENGIVLGSYDSYNGSQYVGSRAFWWSQTQGFVDLGSIVVGGMSESQWQYLADVFSSTVPGATGAGPSYIIARGSQAGQTIFTNYLLTAAVPEPTTLSLFSLAAMMIPRRRAKCRCSPTA